ncbi:MAG: ATP-binding protein [Pseudomonadota bacterium]
MERQPQADWNTFKWIVVIAPAVFLVVAAVLGAWSTVLPLSLFALIVWALVLFSGERRRAVTLHVIIAALVIYQGSLLYSTVDEPNIGIVWFLAVPAMVALLGQRIHILVWTPITLALIGYTWTLYSHYPVLSHPLSLPNLLGAALVVSAAAFGVVTQRARREKALRDALAEARREAMDREIAEAEARKADAAVTTFLGSMSHELRTPLTSIVLSADALDNTLDSQDQKLWTQNIRESADSLVLLLNDILDLARGDAGAAGVKNQAFDVEELIESVRAILQPVAIQRDMCLFVGALPDAPVRWHGDPARVRQVLVNLVNNGLAHSRGSRVFLQARRDGDSLQFVVGDDGIGISKDDQARIFRPFHQLDTAAPADPGMSFASAGTGLGLAIARDYVNAMGAELAVDSEPGQGAMFSFSLGATAAPHTSTFGDRHVRRTGWPQSVWLDAPCVHAIAWGRAWLDVWGVGLDPNATRIGLIDDYRLRVGSARSLANRLSAMGHVPDPPEVPTVRGPADAVSPVFPPRRVAVCDDDPRILQIITETLLLAGHQVDGFADGDALLAHLARVPVDAVVLDVNLAQESGVDVLRLLRALPGDAAATPVCMLSGAWNHRDRCLEAGADEYLLKPSSGDELIETLDRLVREREQALTRPPVQH